MSSTLALSHDGEGERIFAADLCRKVRPASANGTSQREASRPVNISRDSAAKMLAFSGPRGYRRTTPDRRPKQDGFSGIIDGWLGVRVVCPATTWHPVGVMQRVASKTRARTRLAGPTGCLGPRHHRRDHRPFRLGQIACMSAPCAGMLAPGEVAPGHGDLRSASQSNRITAC